ncbi:polyprenyl synthetase family protein [Streptococcus moroccensis]|uniref:Geranylgeranyl diphosphate synthase type II n=1 Tax=Streptococcus moroccensis TaxID=1451356 RepID=A0ABT9YTZ9_9STRE|nr:farnesyl diphosphate synthase [Streptococcus moroccensis]MDQ0223479.1 geranylgeranyl diphosphate synthase type II [Streptococcus moroccensis]
MDNQTYLAGVEAAIEAYYQEAGISDRLVEAVLYSVRAGGKRIRPLLFLQMVEALGQELTPAHYQVAASVEMIHTGSLIHDDLPAMDNDDYRRGRLTNHKQFDEATAILAGDSLFLDPFGLVAAADFSAEIRIKLVKALSDASGTLGMVAGQMLDMVSEGQSIDLKQLETIHANKTGKLLTFPFVAAGLVSEVPAKTLLKLQKIGELVGLAFQVRDDILDLTADFEALGKTPQKDLLAEKSTYPALLGLEESYAFLEVTLDQARQLLAEVTNEQISSIEGVGALIERLRLHA